MGAGPLWNSIAQASKQCQWKDGQSKKVQGQTSGDGADLVKDVAEQALKNVVTSISVRIIGITGDLLAELSADSGSTVQELLDQLHATIRSKSFRFVLGVAMLEPALTLAESALADGSEITAVAIGVLLRWGPMCGPKIEISGGGTIATDVAQNPRPGDDLGGRYRAVVADTGFSSGRHTWGVRVLKKARVYIGVVSASAGGQPHSREGVGKPLHNLSSAWSICVPSESSRGRLDRITGWNGGRHFYTGLPPLPEGGIIGVTLDCDAGTLSFSCNGVGSPEAWFTGLPTNCVFVPVASFGGDDVRGASLELLPASKLE